MYILTEFLVAIVASIVSHYVCKWLDCIQSELKAKKKRQ